MTTAHNCERHADQCVDLAVTTYWFLSCSVKKDLSENSKLMALTTYRCIVKVTCVCTGKTKKIPRYKMDASEQRTSNAAKRPCMLSNLNRNIQDQPDIIATNLDEQPLNITVLRPKPILYSFLPVEYQSMILKMTKPNVAVTCKMLGHSIAYMASQIWLFHQACLLTAYFFIEIHHVRLYD